VLQRIGGPVGNGAADDAGLIGWRPPSDGGEETRGCKDKDVDRMGCTECKGRGVACLAVGSAVVEVLHEGS
jgi:hypothetical protein